MVGAGGVLAVVLLEWTAGWLGAAAWTQSWSVVGRGHFRITAWCTLVLSVLALLANRAALEEGARAAGAQNGAVIALVVGSLLYLAVQYSRTDAPGVVVGIAAAAAGSAALVMTAGMVEGWTQLFAAVQVLAGALLLGAVTNGMMLGHWYLNQPGLKPWALDRLTTLGLGAAVAAGVLGLAAAPKLAGADTSGAVLGLPGFGESFGAAFFSIWILLVVFTGAVVFMARRCVRIKSIQSATGLYYVALLTAGVSEFLVRYLMVNAS